jgi:Papain family cysteine protease
VSLTPRVPGVPSTAGACRERSGRESCRKRATTLCSANPAQDEMDALLLATSPPAYSNLDPQDTGAANTISPPKDQKDCSLCVAFAISAAAEAAVATVLGIPGLKIDLSEQDVAFCPEDPKQPKFCNDGWDLRSALGRLNTEKVVEESCLPYSVFANDDPGAICNYQCHKTSPLAAQGTFSYTQIKSIPDAQSHIRQYGGVISRLTLYSDFKDFFLADPTGVYPGERAVISSRCCTKQVRGKHMEFLHLLPCRHITHSGMPGVLCYLPCPHSTHGL